MDKPYSFDDWLESEESIYLLREQLKQFENWSTNERNKHNSTLREFHHLFATSGRNRDKSRSTFVNKNFALNPAQIKFFSDLDEEGVRLHHRAEARLSDLESIINIFWGSFLITIYAYFEHHVVSCSGISNFQSKTVKGRSSKASIALDKLFIDKTVDPRYTAPNLWKDIEVLRLIRNAVVHENASISKTHIEKLQHTLGVGLSYPDANEENNPTITFSYEYCSQALTTVSAFLFELDTALWD